jgi:DNA-binding transcriptional LysR family regulator
VSVELAKGRLKRVLSDWSSPETPVHAVYPSARHLSQKVSAFVELLREEFSRTKVS